MNHFSLPELVQEFAENVVARNECIAQSDATAANRHARRIHKAFEKLAALGESGRDALLPLLEDTRSAVRVAAAAYLLRHRTEEARAVLEEEARGIGFTAFGAQGALERWADGTWSLDPEP